MKKDKTFWDNIAFVYDAVEGLNKKVYNRMVSRIVALVPKDALVLECAAGTGAVSLAVAPKAKKVWCTDASAAMLKKAQQKAGRKSLMNIHFEERDIFQPPANVMFDAVIAANVLHLLEEPVQAVHTLWESTKKNGVLILPTFLTGKAEKKISWVLKLYALVGFRPKCVFTEEGYRKMLEKCGLPNLQMEVIEGRVPIGFATFQKR